MKMGLEEYLNAHGRLTYGMVGVSMLPLLRQDRDLFTVEKKGAARCKVGDVVLYRRPPDKYVLHRVVEVLPDSYVILGDNCVAKERGITDADIVGVMTGFVRGGRPHSVTEPWYRCYTFALLRTVPVRMSLKRGVFALRRRLSKVRLLRLLFSAFGGGLRQSVHGGLQGEQAADRLMGDGETVLPHASREVGEGRAPSR